MAVYASVSAGLMDMRAGISSRFAVGKRRGAARWEGHEAPPADPARLCTIWQSGPRRRTSA